MLQNFNGRLFVLRKKEIQIQKTNIFYKVNPKYGRRVAEGLKIDLKEFKKNQRAWRVNPV